MLGELGVDFVVAVGEEGEDSWGASGEKGELFAVNRLVGGFSVEGQVDRPVSSHQVLLHKPASPQQHSQAVQSRPAPHCTLQAAGTLRVEEGEQQLLVGGGQLRQRPLISLLIDSFFIHSTNYYIQREKKPIEAFHYPVASAEWVCQSICETSLRVRVDQRNK